MSSWSASHTRLVRLVLCRLESIVFFRVNGLQYRLETHVLRKIRVHLDLLSIPRLWGKNVKTFRWDQRLQIQNLFMAFKQVPRCRQHWVNSIMSGRSPPLYCTFTLIAMFFNLTHLLGGQCDVYLTQIRLHLPSACKVSQKCSDAVGLRVR